MQIKTKTKKKHNVVNVYIKAIVLNKYGSKCDGAPTCWRRMNIRCLLWPVGGSSSLKGNCDKSVMGDTIHFLY